MEYPVTVVICSHNPQPAYLNRVLDALKSQTLPLTKWELLLVDNASNPPLAETIDLSWHLNARMIPEKQLGLVYARLRGLKESHGAISIFVDDDNVLDQDYLRSALEIGERYPLLGAWGGQALPEFDGGSPEEWTRSAWPLLAIAQFDKDSWSNLEITETMPVGAGMCIRKIVGQKYIDMVREDPRRLKLGQRGELLLRCEDFDLALCALDIGLGIGKFARLKLTHILPLRRLTEEYLLNLVKGIVYSRAILDFLRNKPQEQLSWRTKMRYFFTSFLMTTRDRKFLKVTKQAQSMAAKEIREMKADANISELSQPIY
ncbi:MAG: glycosyltransferase [Gloeobacterales cyanobacterium]